MSCNTASLPEHTVLSVEDVRARLATASKFIVVATTVESSRDLHPIAEAQTAITVFRQETATVLERAGAPCIVPQQYGYTWIQAAEGMNDINYRIFKGRFNLYDYQWPLIEAMDDFLATDSRLRHFDGEPLYEGSDYNLSHFAGNEIMYPVDVLSGVIDRLKPELVVCADPEGSSMEHYILYHLTQASGAEYIRMGDESCAE